MNEVGDNPFHEVLGQLCNRRPIVKKKKVIGDGSAIGSLGVLLWNNHLILTPVWCQRLLASSSDAGAGSASQ